MRGHDPAGACQGAPRWLPLPRCTRCGHNASTPAEYWVPRQTREIPARFWLFELLGRLEARMRRRFMHGPRQGRADGYVIRASQPGPPADSRLLAPRVRLFDRPGSWQYPDMPPYDPGTGWSRRPE